MLHIVRTAIVGLAVGSITLFCTSGIGQTGPRSHEFTLVNSEVNGVIMWLPSVIVVHPGERVVLHLFNKLAAVHGLNIEDYDIHAVAYTEGGPNLPAGRHTASGIYRKKEARQPLLLPISPGTYGRADRCNSVR